MIGSAEAVLSGHPDIVADRIAESLFRAYLTKSSNAKVAIDVVIKNNYVILAGEVADVDQIDYERIVYEELEKARYIPLYMERNTVRIANAIYDQSYAINTVANKQLAGDQGVFYGYSNRYTISGLPPVYSMASTIASLVDFLVGRSEYVDRLGTDGKVLVVGDYAVYNPYDYDLRPKRISVSLNHRAGFERLARDIAYAAIEQTIGKNLGGVSISVNPPTGKFTFGGSFADTGITGRKVLATTYGGAVPYASGALCGKDASKPDRTIPYYLRWLANKVILDSPFVIPDILLEAAYEMGANYPLYGVHIVGNNSFGNNSMHDIQQYINKHIMSYDEIVEKLELRLPESYHNTAIAHFGRGTNTWDIR